MTKTLSTEELGSLRNALRLATHYLGKMVAEGWGDDCVLKPAAALKRITSAAHILDLDDAALVRRIRTIGGVFQRCTSDRHVIELAALGHYDNLLAQPEKVIPP